MSRETTGNPTAPAGLEPERYEAFEPRVYHFDLERRDFLKALGGGIGVFLLVRNPAALAQESGRRQFRMPPLPENLGAWLRIAPDGRVTVFTGKVEVGQNIRTSLAQQVAEELHVTLESITMVMGDTARTPYDMGTFGSLTTPTMGPRLRKVASVARDLLIEMAARKWQVDRGRLVAANGTITDPQTGRSIRYGELARGETLARTIAVDDPLTPPAEWKVAGKPAPKVDAVDFVTGRHQYTPDVRLPGMMYGKVLRPPSYGATLATLDDSGARAIPGVVVVRDGNFAGVVAPTPEAAERAVAALRPQWNTVPAETSWQGVYNYIRKNVAETSGEETGRMRHSAGSIEAGMAAAQHRFEQTYTVAYIAHAPLEPRAAVAHWENGKLTVWTGTQRPFAVRDDLVSLFKLPGADSVHVIMPDTGAAYGGKHTGDAAPEAARLARASGKPVKLVWTREEEFTWAYFRPVGVMEVRAGLGAGGGITAWEYHNYNSGPSAIATPYDIPNQIVQFHPTKYPLRQGSYRALAATANHFARESAMDELAHIAGADPLDFRLKHLSDTRLAAVFQAAAKKFGWPRRKAAPGQGFGIAGGIEKSGRIATCAEVAVDRKAGSVRVARVVAAFECGAIVNPDGLNNQVSGAQVMGLGGALFEAIQFADGKILNPAFSKYRVPRFRDVPQIDVVLVDRTDQPPAGAGETPIVGLAPAVANAIFDATGVRLRSMPMAPNGLKPA